MKARWQALAGRYAALAKREKLLVAGTLGLLVGLGGYTVWVEPALLRGAALKKQLAQEKGEMTKLQAQLSSLKSQARDPDAPTKAALAEVRARLSATEGGLRQFEGALVPPQRVPVLLQSLLARHGGLSLVSLRTLPPTPLIAPATEKKDGRPGEAGKTAQAMRPAMPGGNIYKHGIEIKVAGAYPDLLAYLTELEKAPQKLLWGELRLVVTGYPRSELSLTVYSLSLDAAWLVV